MRGSKIVILEIMKKKKVKVSLCLLTWNEINGCKIDVPKIPPVFDRIYAIDNSSNDGTVEFLHSQGIETIKQTLETYNGAYRNAILHADGSALVFFHPKGTIEVESLISAFEKLQDGADFVLASRIVSGGQNEEDNQIFKPRKWFVMLIALAAKFRWSQRDKVFLDDPLHGYRGLSERFIATLELEPRGVTADVEMIRHAYVGNFNSEVFPVKEISRNSGKTHFPAFSTGAEILKYVLTFGTRSK